jgi:hypothetical protein
MTVVWIMSVVLLWDRARSLILRSMRPRCHLVSLAAVDRRRPRRRGVAATDDRDPGLTSNGRSLAEPAIAARREMLSEALADRSADRDPAVTDLVERLAHDLAGEPALRRG